MSFPTERLKNLCEGLPCYGLNTPPGSYGDGSMRFVRTSDITDDGRLTPASTGVFLESADDSVPSLREGDVLVSAGTLGRSLTWRESFGPATFAGYLIRFRPKREQDAVFIGWSLRADPVQQQISSGAIQSTIANFNAERYANLQLPCPSPSARDAISPFLNREIQRLDALIEKKQHLLRLVHERRTAFASRMLRSLPRDSKLGYLAQWLSGGTPPRDREDLWAGDMPWASSADLGEDLDVLAETAQHVTPSAAREWSRLAPAETILIATRGMSLARRLPAVRITRPMAFNQDLRALDFMIEGAGRVM